MDPTPMKNLRTTLRSGISALALCGMASAGTDKTLVSWLALAYQGNRISICRNGERYASYEAANIDLLSPKDNLTVFGLRHVGAATGQTFQGAIEEARIYDRALTLEELKTLGPNEPSEIKPWACWTFEKGRETDVSGRFPINTLSNGARIEGGRVVSRNPIAKESVVGRAVEGPVLGRFPRRHESMAD